MVRDTPGEERTCDNPGPGKAVAAVGVGAESTLVAGRRSAKSKGEEQAGTEDETSKRSTS